MARARNIKPGFFKNEILAELPPHIRLLFVGLWTLADREGRIEDRPKKIRLELCPFDPDYVDESLTALAENGFITRYQADGMSIIQIVNFLKHQSPHGTERDSELPDESGAYTAHCRNANGCTTGNKRITCGTKTAEKNNNNIIPNEINVNQRYVTVRKRPDSPNPKSYPSQCREVFKTPIANRVDTETGEITRSGSPPSFGLDTKVLIFQQALNARSRNAINAHSTNAPSGIPSPRQSQQIATARDSVRFDDIEDEGVLWG